MTALIIAVAAVVLAWRWPPVDKTANALRPQHSDAETALDEITASMGIPQDSLWIIVSGKSEREVHQHLVKTESALSQAASNQVISDYLLPSALWPRVEHQESNRAAAGWLGRQGALLRETALREGFKSDALFLTEELIQAWSRAGASSTVLWPTNAMSQWILKRFVARTTNGWLMAGVVYPPTNQVAAASLANLSAELSENGALLSGWQLLGATTLQRVRERLWLVVLPMVILVLTSLWLAFRRLTEVLLGLAVLFLSGLCLLAIMTLAGWSWNLLNLMALPLMLGTGVDYGIFMQLALRRHGGDLQAVRRSIGRALLLCGGTAIAGFGSLAWSGNAGMASLGKVCAVGIGANMLIAVYVLPSWWKLLSRRAGSQSPAKPQSPALSSPSAFYRAEVWSLGLSLVRVLPTPVLNALASLAAEAYHCVHRRRRETVIENLLPALDGNRAAAKMMARRLFQQFAFKLADLWRYEAGSLVKNWQMEPGTYERFQSYHARGRGVLLVMPHLGNWELGAPLLAQRGIKVLVLTQAEPDDGLTELRKASRAKWGIETLVVANGAFAFVEVIKRLQEGATVALLLDRPPPPTAVTVELFGRPFLASIAAAELARASGCALVRGSILRTPSGYLAGISPEIEYDRQALGNREARRQLTQEILRAFEPEIRQHLDQWYHFVPIWPENAPPKP